MDIVTRKVKATDTKGERISAAYLGESEDRIIVGWDYALDDLANHAEAARRLAGGAVEWTGQETALGYVFRKV